MSQPTLDEFRTRCRNWLADNAERRAADRRKFVWGEGSDSVALFNNITLEEEAAVHAASREWEQRKADAGLGSISWDPQYGGLGLPREYERVYRSEEAGFVVPESHELIQISRNIVAATIAVHGTPEQRAFFVKAMRRADLVSCQMFSEPGAGSDLASLAMRAERDGDEWVVNGQKVWTTGARFADWGYVLCRTGTAEERHRGITAFLVRTDTPGIDVRPLRQMTGGSSFNEVFFDSVRIPDSQRLDGVGEGWRVAMTTLGFERSQSMSAGRVGAPWVQYLALAHHVGVADDPVARQLLARLYSTMQADRWTSLRGLARLQQGKTPGPEGSIAKLAWTNQNQLASEVVSHLLGARVAADTGEWGTYSWSELIVGTPGTRLAGGTDEVQRKIIGERALGLPHEPRPPGAG
jgi:alkylation response protein AidB-like acyl-CoA dehydrogenase